MRREVEDLNVLDAVPSSPDPDLLLEGIRELMEERAVLAYENPEDLSPLDQWSAIRLIDDKLVVRWAALDEHLSDAGRPPTAWLIR